MGRGGRGRRWSVQFHGSPGADAVEIGLDLVAARNVHVSVYSLLPSSSKTVTRISVKSVADAKTAALGGGGDGLWPIG